MKKFPNDFYHFDHSAVRLTDKEIDGDVQAIKKALKRQERDTPKDFSPVFTGTGDTFVIGFRMEDCKTIIVCRNYYELEYAYKE